MRAENRIHRIQPAGSLYETHVSGLNRTKLSGSTFCILHKACMFFTWRGIPSDKWCFFPCKITSTPAAAQHNCCEEVDQLTRCELTVLIGNKWWKSCISCFSCENGCREKPHLPSSALSQRTGSLITAHRLTPFPQSTGYHVIHMFNTITHYPLSHTIHRT